MIFKQIKINPINIIFIFVSILGIIFFGRVTGLQNKPLYFSPPNTLVYFSLGYRDFIANLMWIRFIQDADFCSFKKGIPVYTGGKNYCKWGWSYRMADAITQLAPRFKKVYRFSYTILNIFTGDILGAEKILLKGLKYFPSDWKLNFAATYFYSLEVKNTKLAAYYAHQSAKNGGPYWLYGFSATQYRESKNALLGETILKNLLNSGLSEKKTVYVHKYLKKLQEQYRQ